ncbi:phosphodiester glycosidase family protein [Patescibacteria group bacterium]|nr:phosphodiester glycosidase family protein [Patescibacteria group bacterium]
MRRSALRQLVVFLTFVSVVAFIVIFILVRREGVRMAVVQKPFSGPSTTFTWQVLAPGMDRLETTYASTTGAGLILYRLSSARFSTYFDHHLPPEHVSVWGAEHTTGTALVINGAYFHEDYLPSGFMRVSGTRIGTRSFDLEKSGVILLHPLRMIDTAERKLDLTAYPNALQSYPFLINKGVVAIQQDSGKIARRTFLGLDDQGHIYVGVAPYAPLSLYQLAQALAVLPISWSTVLNLDGGPSTGLFARYGQAEDLYDSYVPVPNTILFTSSPPSE